MTLKAALYIRVSTEEQAERGASISAQEEFLEEWANREGFEIFDTYVDEGFSGKNTNRPALKNLLEDGREEKFQLVLCYHNDRLSRNTRDALTIIQDLYNHGVRFRFSNLDVDITTPEGELFFTLQAGFATYFRKDLTRKTKFGMNKIKRQGYWIGRVPDFFEVRKDRHTRIVPGPIAKRISKLRREGLSYREIALKIGEEEGIEVNHVKVYRTLKVLQRLQ